MKLLKRDFLAWNAGFYEGEGSVGCYRDRLGKQAKLQLTITQKESKPLELIRDYWKFGTVRENKKRGYYYYEINKYDDVLIFCYNIMPFLQSDYKRKQMEDAVLTYLNREPSNRKNHSPRMGITAHFIKKQTL